MKDIIFYLGCFAIGWMIADIVGIIKTHYKKP